MGLAVDAHVPAAKDFSRNALRFMEAMRTPA